MAVLRFAGIVLLSIMAGSATDSLLIGLLTWANQKIMGQKP